MPRGIPWDDLPRPYKVRTWETILEEKRLSSINSQDSINKNDIIPMKRDYQRDFTMISKRIAFGMICGSITGASFGIVDILRDAKAVSGKKKDAMIKVAKYAGLFAG